MAAQRFYYSDTISRFLSRSDEEIIGHLALGAQHDLNDETKQSWLEEIYVMKNALADYNG